jgi:hypothetical protein
MLQVIYTTDKEILKPLYDALFKGEEISGVNAVLMDGDIACGICTLKVDSEVTFQRFAVLPEFDNFANKDFFFRVVLYKLSLNDYIVVVPKVDERLIKFGFVADGGKMYLKSKEVQFPSTCGGH